jgi:hypothetical protein
MIRHAAAIAVVVCLIPSWLSAQSAEFTVNAGSASVHKSPSTGSPVIGKVSRGAVLRVTRELGSWVRIAWPAAPDGIGYLHMTTGWLAHITAPGANRNVSAATGAPKSGVTPATAVSLAATSSSQPSGSVTPAAPVTVGPAMAPTAHSVGFGGRIGGSTLGVGASARAAIGNHVGVQVEVSRYALTSAVAQQRLTSLQFAPSVLVSLPDKVTDYVWLRPYVGAGITMYRSTLSGATIAADSVSDNRMGRQAFGGVEAAFAAVPRFTLSADYGYRWPQTPFEGFELGGRGLAVSGHWYIR